MSNTYRDIFKWGDAAYEEKLDEGMINFLKQELGLKDEDFNEKYLPGDSGVKLGKKGRLSGSVVKSLKRIAGSENVSVDDYDRAYHAYGKFYLELVSLRKGRVENPPDAVVYPRDEKDIQAIIKLCSSKKIPIVPFGGHSSVTRGVEASKGGISLDLTRHMNRVLKVNEINATVRVQPGIYGRDLERYLNEYMEGYTCGHFPQSFEYSTAGGWAAARGAGQASTGYGKIEDIVLSMRMITPRGEIATRDYPAASLGPDIDQILIGSEGTFGVITELTMKIRKYLPGNASMTSFVFRDFESAVRAMREVMQGQFGKPHLFRISDAEETDAAFRMKGKDNTIEDKVLRFLGYQPMKRCLMFAAVEGDRAYTRFVVKKIRAIALRHGAFCTGASLTKKWLDQRYSSSYLRDSLMDAGVLTDTLETAVTWENLLPLWSSVRDYIKKRPNTVCMVHISHVYENGANLYFIFLSRMKKGDEANDFTKFHKGIIDAIAKNGGSLSHHHGIGRMLAPWMEQEVGSMGMGLLHALKDYFDPRGIMNPGGTLGLK